MLPHTRLEWRVHGARARSKSGGGGERERFRSVSSEASGATADLLSVRTNGESDALTEREDSGDPGGAAGQGLEHVVVVREGWLEKRADNVWPNHWGRRYVRLLPGRLCWARDEEGTKARDLQLDARTVATIEPDLTLRIVCEERTVALRLCAAGGGNDAGTAAASRLRAWSAHVVAAASTTSVGHGLSSADDTFREQSRRSARSQTSDGAALILQAQARARMARRQLPLALSQLCCTLNDCSWAKHQVSSRKRGRPDRREPLYPEMGCYRRMGE